MTTRTKSQSPPRLPAAAPPPAPHRWPVIPQVAPTDPAFLIYSMMNSYTAGTTPEIRAATASLIMGQLHRHPALHKARQVKVALEAIVADLSRFDTGFGLIAYTLASLT